MSTRGESRHRWTKAERDRLLEKSKAYDTVAGAAEALYPDFGVTKNACGRQLYSMVLRGKAPWLTSDRKKDAPAIPTRWMLASTRMLADAMRQAGANEAFITLAKDGTVTAIFSRGAETGVETM